MEERLAVKINALEVLEKQLSNRAKKNQHGIVVVGSATDAYSHHEEVWRMTEGFLKLLLKYRFPVFISTKCNLILRDLELLKEIDSTAMLPDDLRDKLKHGVILSVSVSTMDEKIAQALEPGAILPVERLQLIQQLKQHGFICGVNAIPVLPFISDTEEELEKIFMATKQHNADYILVGGLTLFGNNPADSKTLYFKFIERNFPHLISSYHQLYGEEFFPPWWYQEQLQERVDHLCRKYKIRNSILEKK
jgi:DNA repair photolyase